MRAIHYSLLILAVLAGAASASAQQFKVYIAVDLDPHKVTQAAKQNLPVYYGDATLPEILDVVHIENARAMVVALSSATSRWSRVVPGQRQTSGRLKPARRGDPDRALRRRSIALALAARAHA